MELQQNSLLWNNKFVHKNRGCPGYVAASVFISNCTTIWKYFYQIVTFLLKYSPNATGLLYEWNERETLKNYHENPEMFNRLLQETVDEIISKK